MDTMRANAYTSYALSTTVCAGLWCFRVNCNVLPQALADGLVKPLTEHITQAQFTWLQALLSGVAAAAGDATGAADHTPAGLQLNKFETTGALSAACVSPFT